MLAGASRIRRISSDRPGAQPGVLRLLKNRFPLYAQWRWSSRPSVNKISSLIKMVSFTFGVRACFKPRRFRHWRIDAHEGLPSFLPNAALQKSASAWSAKKHSAGSREL